MGAFKKFVNLPFGTHLVIATIIRLFLILYGQFHDQVSSIPYTDVDYRVFTDAARHIINEESPYKRHTYRYSPLLAMMMVPNVLMNQNFGKILFSLVDILVGVAIKKLVVENKILLADGKPLDMIGVGKTASQCALCWLYNPLAIVIATRGNADTIASFLVIMSLIFHETELVRGTKKYFLSGIFLGLAIHFRLYPIIFSVPMFFAIADYKIFQNTKLFSDLFQLIPNWKQMNLVAGCLLSLGSLTIMFYRAYGYDFIFESYLYHMFRKDTRHNFSVYFYLQYLTDDDAHYWHRTVPLILLITHIGVRYGRQKTLNFALFLEVTIMVAYNSVLTSQYFIWYLSLLPLCISDFNIKRTRGIFLCCIWLATQAAWLFSAYALEFRGKNTFLQLWFESLLFFMAHLYIIIVIVRSYAPGYEEKEETILVARRIPVDDSD